LAVRYAVAGLVLPVVLHFEQGPGGGPALTPYRDSAGYWTIGYGHRCAPGFPVILPAHALTLAEADLQCAAVFLNQALGPQVTASLSDGQFAALTDFVFNEGGDEFLHSTLHACVMHGRNDLVPGELEHWIYAHVDGKPVVLDGLVKRRAAEVALWTTGAWSPPT
jgi:lysozyme